MSGLNGGFEGSCIACLTGTDTGIGIGGDAEWKAAALTVMGVPMDQAVATINALIEDHQIPDGTCVVMRVCAACAAKMTTVKPVLLAGDAAIPVIGPVAS